MKKNFVYGHHTEARHWPKLVQMTSSPSTNLSTCQMHDLRFYFHRIIMNFLYAFSLYSRQVKSEEWCISDKHWSYRLFLIWQRMKVYCGKFIEREKERSLPYLLLAELNIVISLHRINERLQGCRTREHGKYNWWAVTVDTMPIISWHEVHLRSFMSTI